MHNVRAVAVVVNSPGGSAVQSSLIMKRIRKLREETKVPVVAFVEDVAASGGYYIACGADEIYADEVRADGSGLIWFSCYAISSHVLCAEFRCWKHWCDFRPVRAGQVDQQV